MRRARAGVAAGGGRAPGLRAVPLSLFAASCLPMLVMLPAGLTGVLASLGIRAEAGWVQAIADPLGPVAQPLLVVSTVLLALASLSCGRSPALAALAGGTLLYLGMYVVTGPGAQTEPRLFYPGLALFLASPALSLVRPRLRACRPLLPRAGLRRLLLAAAAGPDASTFSSWTGARSSSGSARSGGSRQTASGSRRRAPAGSGW